MIAAPMTVINGQLFHLGTQPEIISVGRISFLYDGWT